MVPVGGRLQQDHHGVGGQLITFHITRLEAPCPSWVAMTGEEEPGGDGGVDDFCGRGEEEFARGKRPGGAVLFKNSERMFRKSESEMSADLLFVFE